MTEPQTDPHAIQRNHPRPVFQPGRLISVILVAVIVILIISTLTTNPNYHWDKVGEYLFHPTMIRGIGYTLLLTIAAMFIGVILAITMAIMRQSPNPVLKSVAWFYIWFFRGTPIYTQLIFWGLLPTLYPLISFGSLQIDIKTVWDTMWAAIFGLGLNEGAYLAEIVRAGLKSVDQGQWEAATALGMKRSLIMRRIILPQAMRVIVPPTGNETISMLKTTSLVSAVPFTLELTFAAQALGRQIFLTVPMLICAAIWYLVITSILMVGQHYLEKYFGKGFNHGGSARIKHHVKESDMTQANPGAFLDVTP